MTHSDDSNRHIEERGTYRLPAETLEDRVWNTIVAQTNEKQPPPKRLTIIRALCDRDKSDPYDPEIVDAVIDGLIEQDVIEESDKARLRIVSQLE